MDELELLRDLRAGLPPARAEARAYARGCLVTRAAEHELKRPRSRLAWLSPRPRLLVAAAFAGAGVVAVVVLGVLNGGGRVEPAAAQVLRQTATVAAAADITPETPGPGELLYSKTRSLAVWGWDSDGDFVGLAAAAERGNAFTALATIDAETWTSAEGMVRMREELGSIRFLADTERSRWEEAGSPLPGQFDPSAEDVHADAFGHILRSGGRVLELRRGVVDLELAPGHGRALPVIEPPDPSTLPTEPEALRRAVEHGGFSSSVDIGEDGEVEPSTSKGAVDPEETIFGLWTILSRSTITETPAAVRAAAFDALAEMPVIELDRDATDLVGRTGDAIAYRGDGGDGGLRHEFVFDPATSQALGERSVLADPERGFAKTDLPLGTVISEVAFLESSIVDRDDAKGEPAATTRGHDRR